MIPAYKKISVRYNLKKITSDFGLSIIASVISTGIIQLIVYPILAKMFDSSIYGLILTTMAIANTISISLGNTLNNTRLIQNTKYAEANLIGDFNLLLLIINAIGFTSIIVIGNLFFDIGIQTSLLLGLIVVLITLKSYLVVAYRLKLNFKLNLLCNIITSIGYIVGVFIAKYTGIWPLAFLIGEIFCLVFVLFTIDLLREPLIITVLFKDTLSKYLILIFTGLSGNLMLYLDRLVIFPLLGGESVSIYTVASFFGKSLGIILLPIASVLLGYYSQKNFKMTMKRFWTINFAVFSASVLFFFIALPISPWFTGVIYPTIIESSNKYIMLANMAAIIGVTASIVQPAILKFAPIYWQLVKEAIYGVTYVFFGIILTNKYGLQGFCVAAIMASSLKLFLLYFIGTISIKRANLVKCEKI